MKCNEVEALISLMYSYTISNVAPDALSANNGLSHSITFDKSVVANFRENRDEFTELYSGICCELRIMDSHLLAVLLRIGHS